MARLVGSPKKHGRNRRLIASRRAALRLGMRVMSRVAIGRAIGINPIPLQGHSLVVFRRRRISLLSGYGVCMRFCNDSAARGKHFRPRACEARKQIKSRAKQKDNHKTEYAHPLPLHASDVYISSPQLAANPF